MSRLRVLEHCYWTAEDKLKALEHLTLTDLRVCVFMDPSNCVYIVCLFVSLQEFVSRFKQQLFVEALVQGNITSKVSLFTTTANHISHALTYFILACLPQSIANYLISSLFLCTHAIIMSCTYIVRADSQYDASSAFPSNA